MSRIPDQKRERICALFAAKVPVRAIAEQFGVQAPAIWRSLRRWGILPPYNRSPGRGPARKRPLPDVSGAEPNIADLPPRVERDPCPRCGVRADVGCSHSASYGLTVAA